MMGTSLRSFAHPTQLISGGVVLRIGSFGGYGDTGHTDIWHAPDAWCRSEFIRNRAGTVVLIANKFAPTDKRCQ